MSYLFTYQRFQKKSINSKADEFIKEGQPVISVDTKKKEKIGNFKNPGTEYRKKKDPRHVLDHDFPIPELGKVVPYGIYVLNENTEFVNPGTVIELIGSTTTTTGLKVICIPDYNKYELGKKVSDKEFNNLPVKYLNNLGKRNYIIDASE